ncbi:MAG: VWA domain-containing protein [Candidatus Aminicenantales bacterium]
MIPLILILGFLSIPSARGQAGKGLPPQDQQAVDVRLVLVDVIAMKGGEFVQNLKKSDFRVFSDGKEVPINSCELIGTGRTEISAAVPDQTPVVAQKRRLAVLFDGVNDWDREFKKGAQEIEAELASLAREGTEVMILFVDSNSGLRVVQPFTDQEALIRAAAGKASGDTFSPFLEYKNFDDVLFVAKQAGLDIPDNKGGENLAQVMTRPMYELRSLEHTNSATEKFSRIVGGLVAAIAMLEDLPGRKNIMFVSGGFPDIEGFQRENMLKQLPNARMQDQAASTPGVIGVYDPFGILGHKLFKRGGDVLKELVRVANDRNISIYSYDPGTFARNVFTGPSAEYFDRESAESVRDLADEKYRQTQNLRIMSEKTGASYLRGSDKIKSFREVVRNDLSYCYVLSFYPPKDQDQRAYHEIDVRLRDRKGIDLRHREGYSDSFTEQTRNLALARAFHDPDSFQDKLPFRAEFAPFASGSKKYRPWMNLALPVKEFFIDGFPEYGTKTFQLHFWIRDEGESGRILSGEIGIPVNVDSSFRERLSPGDFLRLSFVGPEIETTGRGSRIILALFDPQSEKIGTWSEDFAQPVSKEGDGARMIAAVMGNGTPAAQAKAGGPALNADDGKMEFGSTSFLPKIAGAWTPGEDVSIFLQVYDPGSGKAEVRFDLANPDVPTRPIGATQIADVYDGKSKIRNSLFKLDFGDAAPGDYVLGIEVLSAAGGPSLRKEIELSLAGR